MTEIHIEGRQWRYSAVTETFTIDLSYEPVDGDAITAKWLEVQQDTPDGEWTLTLFEGNVDINGNFGAKGPTTREELDRNFSIHYVLGMGIMYAANYAPVQS